MGRHRAAKVGVTSSEETRNDFPKIIPKRNGRNFDDSDVKSRKKIKIDKMEDQRDKRLAKLITDFNLNVNELFQLREYKSVVYWNPLDFSLAAEPSLSELFEAFLKNQKYNLTWYQEDDYAQKLKDLPLRLQKKVLAERDQKVAETFPFRERVLEISKSQELHLLKDEKKDEEKMETLHSNHTMKPDRSAKFISRREKHFEGGADKLQLKECANTNYKLKAIKYSIPASKVTHPSHIPNWIPGIPNDGGLSNGNEHSMPEAGPDKLEIINSTSGIRTIPDINGKLENFLRYRYKCAIIDDGAATDYNYTLEEYNSIMKQQEDLVRKIYQKVMIEKSLELNGDKVERRKVVLPHSSNLKQVSDPFRSNGSVNPKHPGGQNNVTYYDHFLNQAITVSKIRQQMRRLHYMKTKKIAQMIELYFKKKKGEKERIERERAQNLKRMSRLAALAVKKRWIQATKVYRYLQLQKEDELKQIRGREHLSQMIEHSTQLLEAQLTNRGSEGLDSDHAELLSDDSDLNSDGNFTSSTSESEENIANKDLELTVEELNKKYAHLLDNSIQDSRSKIDQNENEGNHEPLNIGLKALYDVVEPSDELSTNTDYTEKEKERINELKMDKRDNLMGLSESLDLHDSEVSENNEVKVEKRDSLNNGKVSKLASLFNSEHLDNDASQSYSSSAEADSDDEIFSTTDEDDEPKTPKSVTSPFDKTKNDQVVKEEEINGSKVQDVPIPFLLRGTLRPYQKQGLNWLASLYNNGTNGILADEMGLGKTLQTISLLAYLACEHHIWGPHLIIVPTSVMLNWEMEFKKFAPGFKVLTYYGSPQQRAQKRKGWNKPDAFHVCITSYQLVVHDQLSFKRRRWKYMILDEAHNIKNFRSNRWRALLNFNTENRLLLTGTPLQNNLIELWSLLYFLMPSSKANQAMPDAFANLDDFQTWFGRPVDKILEQTGSNELMDGKGSTTTMDQETRNTVSRLHQVLRPFLLRRLKKDVEKQMPGKFEHIVYCRLSKRQRFLYDDFMSRAKTKETLSSGNFLSIINCLMQLRKVCNHPDLFEVRPIVTSYAMPKSVVSSFNSTDAIVRRYINDNSFKNEVNMDVLNLDIVNLDSMNYFVAESINRLKSSSSLEEQKSKLNSLIESSMDDSKSGPLCLDYYKMVKRQKQEETKDKLEHFIYLNNLRCGRSPIFGCSLLNKLKSATASKCRTTSAYIDIVPTLFKLVERMTDTIEKFSVITPAVVALDMKDQLIPISTQYKIRQETLKNNIDNPFHKSQVKLSIAFPDKSLLQYDCGKLQRLATLLQDLTSKGHRALIFTQMTKVLDVLEQFLNIHGYRYMRLDGATKIDDRQMLTERFNRDNKIPVFILSTRSGGLGINLTGADTVIFYDSDWNPAMDKQCQDRCHRIGQSREVHIYRFVSEYTIESNILKKANQKRQLDNVVIQEGEFTTDYFGKLSLKDLVNDSNIVEDVSDRPIAPEGNVENALAQAEDEDDRAAASEALKESVLDNEDFNEESNSATAEGSPFQTPAPPETTSQISINGSNVEDEDFEEGVGHVDEYMLRFIAEGYFWE
ncbi:uncharacterized protein PRCAT00001643001 [Priceomyces carsonii]|uniref:uncharacterized protein n=1 Tax=Priceomyces carsonii TaxID=28549 RepID=UPI002ED81908|nr:unnamed protein product [Priceomyces carsonii]